MIITANRLSLNLIHLGKKIKYITHKHSVKKASCIPIYFQVNLENIKPPPADSNTPFKNYDQVETLESQIETKLVTYMIALSTNNI